jgi:hypothetical protein
MGADCDIDPCLLVSKVRERLAVSKQEAKNFDVERFNLRQLREVEFMKQYQIEIPNRVAPLENISDSEYINRTWENIKENIKTSAKGGLCLNELKQHKPWFDEECLRFLKPRRQVKMQWVQDPNQRSVGNLNN